MYKKLKKYTFNAKIAKYIHCTSCVFSILNKLILLVFWLHNNPEINMKYEIHRDS